MKIFQKQPLATKMVGVAFSVLVVLQEQVTVEKQFSTDKTACRRKAQYIQISTFMKPKLNDQCKKKL
jgi:hypothetical protein